MNCPYCMEELPGGEHEQCPQCGERLSERKEGLSTGALIGIVVAAVLVGGGCLISIVAAIAIPNLLEARKRGNETVAIGALKTISTAQSLFREGDKDGDEVFDYASLRELSDVAYIDGFLGSGTKQGYLFQVQASPQTPEFLWMAVAEPVKPGSTGERYFVTNQAGVVFYGTQAPFQISGDCAIPTDATPLGR